MYIQPLQTKLKVLAAEDREEPGHDVTTTLIHIYHLVWRARGIGVGGWGMGGDKKAQRRTEISKQASLS